MRILGVIAFFAAGCFNAVSPLPDAATVNDGASDAGIRCTLPRDCPPPTTGCTYSDCVQGYCTSYEFGVCDGGAACLLAADCSGSKPSVPWCSQPDAGSSFSCVNQSCLWECQGGRVCSLQWDGGCLECTIPQSHGCTGIGCFNPSGTATVESATCANPVVAPPTPFVNTSLTFGPLGDCRSEVAIAAGAPIGEITQLSTGDIIGDFPSMGGLCTGRILPTNLTRMLINCPSCQFTVRF